MNWRLTVQVFAIVGGTAAASTFPVELVRGISITTGEIYVGDKSARIGDTITVASQDDRASYRLLSVGRESIRVANKDTEENVECPVAIVPEWETTITGTWVKGIELNSLLSILARKADRQYWFNLWLSGEKVTGHLGEDDPFESVRALCPQYGLALYIKQDTLFALTGEQQEKIPRSTLACSADRLSSEKLIEQIKPLLSHQGIVNYDPARGKIVLCDTPVVVGAIGRFLGQVTAPTAKVAIGIEVFALDKHGCQKRLASKRLVANNGVPVEWQDGEHGIAIGILPVLLSDDKVSLRVTPRVESGATKNRPAQVAESEVCGVIRSGDSFHFEGLFQRETTRLFLRNQTRESNVCFAITACQQP